MNETKSITTWIAAPDSRKGRLFEARRRPTGRIHLDPRGELAEAWEEKPHHRPDMLSDKGRTVASSSHEDLAWFTPGELAEYPSIADMLA